MTAVELLREGATSGFQEFTKALEGIQQPQAWAVLPPASEEYLHTDGSIHGIVLHAAEVKRMYGSICFRNTETRWRDVANEIESFEPDWNAALAYLHESHRYWMESWSSLTDEDLEADRPTNWPEPWPAWRIIRLMNHHDAYHAGQIAVLRYANGESDTPPPSCAEDVRQYCSDSPHW
ncbi:hypothetical protein BH11ARM2_BH11ARM2_21200 [soil metagenome]